ncbi:MAG: ABC transporter transmembrane domain-containing protein [Pseudomonadota bacterium]|nr:ABC transporter transmembrane domain-containing protein [Pseudomonadota bacterium]
MEKKNIVNRQGASQKFEERGKGRSLSSLTTLFGFFKPYKLNLILASLVLIATAGISLSFPIAIRRVVDGFYIGSTQLMDSYFIAAIGLASFLAIGTALRFYLVTRLGERVVTDIRIALFKKVISMSPGFFERLLTGEILSRITTDTTLILSVVSSSVSLALRNILLLIGGLIFMFLTSVKLSLLVLLLVPIMVIPILVMGRKLRRLSRDSQSKIADSSGLASEMLLAASTIQAFNYTKEARRVFSEISEDSFRVAKRRIKIRSLMTALIIFVVFVGIVIILWVGARDVRSGTISPGFLVQFVIYSSFVAGAVAALSEVFGELQRAAGATERITELLTSSDPIKPPQNLVRIVQELVDGTIIFRNVTFYYPTRPSELVLKNLNFTLEKGKTLALVGPSGAGKSSVFLVLLRFYEFFGGTITLDGKSIKEMDPENLREQIAFVPQEPAIFANSVLENIRFGRPAASDLEVENAAKRAAAYDFIVKLPKGFDTFVGEKGVLLSVGQKQRIAIARAFLRDAPILLLDEATASLDAENENEVQNALEELSQKRTVIVIAHRLSTVKRANKILVLDQGQIIAKGTHEELLRENGLYNKLAKLQFIDR